MDVKPQNTIPTYNREKDCYQVIIDGRTEEGCIEYVISEYISDGLFYRFSIGFGRDHEHTFSDVLSALLFKPKEFSISGFEEDYSAQQIRMLEKTKARLLEHLSNPLQRE